MIYVSTGGFKDMSPTQAIKFLNKNGINKIELSGGKFEENLYHKLKKFKTNHFSIHNYFPIPKKPFVINIASLNSKINQKSMKQLMKGINLANKLNLKYFSFHAGFYLDPRPKNLGKIIESPKLFPKIKSDKKFYSNIKKLVKFSKKKKIKIFIENNVITKKNLKLFNINPLMLCSYSDLREIRKKFPPKDLGFLLDIGHLKVSSKTLKKNFYNELKKIVPLTDALHLSENDALVDSNNPLIKRSKLWRILKKKYDFVTIEVYKKNAVILKNQIKLVNEKLY